MDTRLLVFLALVATALAGPISNQDFDKCSTTCPDSSKFRYDIGTTYIYDYKVDTLTSVAGASEDTAKLTLQTSGHVEVLSPCEFSLQLRNTRLFHTDGSGNMKTADREVQFRSGLEAYPLRFSHQDGKIEHVCQSNGDDAWTMNLKRGFLSAFQNSMDDLTQSQNVTETDVAGTCKTEYTVVSNGYYVTSLKKTKNILSCTDRHNVETMIQSTPYFIPSDIQAFPLMKTTHECEQSVEVGGVLKSTVCTESHIYRPFANGMSGGSTTVTQTLTYNTYRRSTVSSTGSFESRGTLAFDHSGSKPTKYQARRLVEQKLGEICHDTRVDIRPNSPRLFSELISAMKKMDSDDMEDIYRLLKTKTLCPENDRTYKFFIDALPMTNTRNSVRLMSKLIRNEDVKGLQAKAWLTSLAFIPHPTSEMISDVKGLIDSEKLREDASLPVSSLINNYCKMQTTCDHDYAVLSTMSSLEKTIGYQCDASGKNFQKILLTLRAIGNAGHASRAINVLNKCMTQTSNPMEIRIAAIEAFRRMPCGNEDMNLWNLFLDRTLDSELRIASYLALMRCPTEENLGKIASALYKEDNDQVGAFVYSHLTNLRESSNPHKQKVAEMINNLALDKEFDMSPLKHSRNYEISTLINKLNTGFTAESNMIWSSSDQLPRSLAGNLTVELFGQSINLFDFGGRLEGLEYLLRNVLGPYVNSDEKGEKKVNFDKVQGSVFGRIFGNEMLFLHSKTAKSPFGNLPSKWLDVLIKLAKKQEFSFTQNFQFIDVCMEVPTAAGLPVQVHLNGSAVVDLSVNGKMDLRKVGTSPRSMDVDGEIRPSAALEVTGTMAVNAFVTKTGLRMRNTLHSSTSLKGRIQLNRGQQLNIEMDTPEDKQEIFGAKSQFFILHNDIEKEQEMIKENRREYEMCSGSTLATVTGMELCGQLSYANASLKLDSPYFPFTGPTALSVTLFKKDTHSGYKLFAKRIENKKASIAQFSVNTPGSKVDRAITVDMTLNYAKKMMEVNMFSPWKKTEIKGNVINQGGMKSVAGKLIIDDVHVYALTSEVKTVRQKNKIQYSPMIEISRPGADNIQLVGLIAMESPVKSLNIDMSLTGIQKLPYTLKANVVNTRKEKSLTASFSADNKNVYSIEASNLLSVIKKSTIASLKSTFNLNTPTKRLISISGSGDYREDKSLKMDTTVSIYRLMRRPAALKLTLVKNANKKGSRYDLDAVLKSSKLSARIDSNMAVKKSGLISTKMLLDYNIPRVDRNTIVFSGKMNDRSTEVYKKYSARGNFKVKKNPDYNIDLVLDLDHKTRLSEVELDLKYGPNTKDKTKKIYFLTSLTKRISDLKNAVVNYKIKAQAPEHNVDVYLGGKHTHTPKMLDSSIQLNYGKNKDMSAALTLRDQSAKLSKLNGKMNVAWPGTEYAVNTQLIQKSAKQYSHLINIKCNDGTKHTMSTTYKMPKAATHAFTTQLNIHDSEPVTLTGSTTLNMRNFAASGKVLSGKDTYGIVTTSRITKAPNAKINVELIHPARRMTLDVSGGKNKDKYEGSVAAAWDADNKNSKVVLDGAYVQKTFKGAVSMGGNVNFQSPFTNFEDLLASFKYSSDPSEHNVDGKFSWGGKGKQIVSSMNVKKDFGLRNIDVTVELKTPFKGFRNAEISIDHNLDDSLNTVVKGNVEKENVKLVLQGQDQSDNYKTNMKGNLALRSTLKNAEVITAAFSHSLSNGKLLSSAEMNHNGQKYECDMNIVHDGSGWYFKNNGDVTIKAPKQKLTTKWTHKNSDKTVKCSLISTWGKNTLKVDLSGSHELSNLRELKADLQIRSPWRVARNIEASLDHKHGSGLVQSNALLNQNGKTKLSSKVNFKGDHNAADFDFEFKTPMSEDLSGKLNAQYDKYPMTSSAQLTWAPRERTTLESSLNLASLDDASVNMKLTTPSTKYRNILFKASNKRQNDEVVSHLVLDYGVRKNIDLESHMAYGEQKKFARVTLLTPFENLKSLETGLSFDGSSYNFDSRAHFELLPTLGKFETLVNWQYDNDLSGKIRLNTPFQDYPYFELVTSSNLKSASRQSRVQLEYHPHQVFTVDTAHTFELPLAFEATIRSPYPEYDNLGLSIQHNHADSFIRSHGEITYQPDSKIVGDLNADWSSDIDGTLVVKTPFQNFESNQISIRHKGNRGSFSTHGEVFIAQKKVAVDASLKTGFATTGTFTMTSPIPGMESIKATLRKRGTIDNVKGGIVFMLNEDKTQANFNNKLTQSSIKSGLSIFTPYTENFKLSLEHNGPIKSFANKMSLNYGRKVDIDTTSAFNMRGNGFDGNAMLKYKIGKGRTTARLNLKKSGPIEDMSFSGTASLNRDDISVSGTWKSVGEIDGSVVIKTPFENFKTTSMSLSHKGDLSYFQSNANINYMDNKSIYGKVELTNRDGKRVKFLSQLSTPFKNLKASSFEFNNEINEISNQIDGNIVLTTTLNKFGSGNIAYTKSGDLNNLMVDASVTRNGKDLAALKMTNNFQANDLHSKFDLKTVATPAVFFQVDHSGDFFSFNTKTVATVGKNTVSSEANMKRGYQSFDADGLVLYKYGRAEKKCSINVHTDGDWERCNLRVSGILNKDEVKLSASKQGSIEDLSFKGMTSYNGKSVDVDGHWKNKASIDGRIGIQTPFENYKNIGLTLSHSGDISKFSSSATLNYMDNKQINGNMDLTAYSLDKIMFSTRMSTPFKNFEFVDVKFNNNFDSYSTDISGNAAISTPIADVGTKALRYSKTGTLNNLKIEVISTDNGIEASSLKISQDRYGKEVHSIVDFKSSSLPEMLLALDHSGDLNNLKTIAKGKFGKSNVIRGEVNWNMQDDAIDGEGKLMYNIASLGQNEGSVKIHQEGEKDDFNVGITITVGNKVSKLNANFKNTDELLVSATLNTPVNNYKNVGLSLRHSGSLERFNCDGKIEIMDGMVFTGKVNFYRFLFRRIETVVEITTPLKGLEFTKYEYRHEGEQDNFKCSSTLQYGDSKKIVYDLTASTSPNPDFTLSLKTSEGGISASGSLDYVSPKYAIQGKLEDHTGRVLTIDGSLDTTNDIIGSLNLNSPVEKFTDIGLSFSLHQRENGFESNGQITYMDGKTISLKNDIMMTGNGRAQMSTELRTPFSGYEFTKLEQIYIINKKMVKSTMTLIYENDKTIVYEVYRTLRPKQEFVISLKTPFENYEEMMVFLSLDNRGPKYSLNSKINAGNNIIYSLAGSLDNSDDISGSLNIATPHEGFTDIGMDFLHSGDSDKFGTEGKITYMDGKDISGKMSFYRFMWRRIVASTELNTPFMGMENTKAEMSFEDNSNSISTMALVEYGAGNKLNGNLKLTYSPTYDIMLTLDTPFNDYKLLRTQGSLDMTAPSYEMTYSIDSGNSQIYSATGKLNFYSIENLDASLEMSTPLSDFEYTKVDYNHKIDANEIDGSASLFYKNGQKMSAELKTTLTPNFDAVVTLKTPFSGFETMQGTATFEESYNRYEASSSLNLGGGQFYSMSSDIDYSSFPMRASAKVSTPYTDFRNMELTLTHDGELNNFISTGHFSSPLTDNINTKASLKYESIFDMTAAASLQSALPGFDDLRTEVKMSNPADETKAHLLVGWTSGQEIIVDGTRRLQSSWYENHINTDFIVSTPFTAVQSLSWHLDLADKEDAHSQKLNFELNGDNLIDVDSEYKSKDKPEIQISFRKPWPMLYSASMSRDSEITDAEVLINWNRNEADSNIRMQTTLTDKSNAYQTDNSVDIRVTHASRQVGLLHKLNMDDTQISSGGNIYWDANDDTKVSYDLQLSTSSRRRKQMLDGSFKLGLPTRTLGLTSSFSDNKVAKTADVTFNWDMDRDDSQQVGVKATVNQGQGLKGDIALSLPSLRKEIRVDGEMMMKNGRIIFDAKTDFSYSKDSRKTLTLTSKLADVSDYYSNFNYSLSFGVRHPYTNLDLKVNSHVGSSDERTTFGMNTDYLTARRQIKNLALLTEINKLKKQINLQVHSPMSRIEIAGDVVSTSPCKIRMSNKVNDIETFRSDMTIDEKKKSFILNAFMDAEGWTISAKYPNNSAFQAEIIHHSPNFEHKEALLGVRLNTSRLLHTRLSWRPELMQELNEYLLEKAVEEALSARATLAEMNEAMRDEISAKYIAITDEFVRELQPFVSLLNEELSVVAVKMGDLYRELRAMYERNDFYVQDMGEEVNVFYMRLQERLVDLTYLYKLNYQQLIRSMTESLRDLRSFPIQEEYSKLVRENVQWIDEKVTQSLSWIETMMEELDKTLQEYKSQALQVKQQALDTIYNATYVDYISNKIGQIQENVNIRPYITSFKLPEEYTNAIYDAHSSMYTTVNDFLDRSNVKYLKEGVNEVYQQGKWAYHYWQLEENIRKHTHSILQILKEIIEDELKELSQELQFVVNNPITVWDPEHGEIQADFPLPIVVKRLDQMPDFSPLVKKAEAVAVKYLPDQTTWNKVVKAVSEVLPLKEDNQNMNRLPDGMTKERPVRRNRRNRRRFRVRSYQQ